MAKVTLTLWDKPDGIFSMKVDYGVEGFDHTSVAHVAGAMLTAHMKTLGKEQPLKQEDLDEFEQVNAIPEGTVIQ